VQKTEFVLFLSKFIFLQSLCTLNYQFKPEPHSRESIHRHPLLPALSLPAISPDATPPRFTITSFFTNLAMPAARTKKDDLSPNSPDSDEGKDGIKDLNGSSADPSKPKRKRQSQSECRALPLLSHPKFSRFSAASLSAFRRALLHAIRGTIQVHLCTWVSSFRSLSSEPHLLRLTRPRVATKLHWWRTGLLAWA
jgi:hypothetical protein